MGDQSWAKTSEDDFTNEVRSGARCMLCFACFLAAWQQCGTSGMLVCLDSLSRRTRHSRRPPGLGGFEIMTAWLGSNGRWTRCSRR